MRQLHEQDTRLLAIGERITVAGLPFCSRGGWSSGFAFQQLAQYGRDYRLAAGALLGIGEAPTITVVLPGGAAQAAGIRPGDRIVAIDGKAVAAPRLQARGDFAGVAGAQDALEKAFADGAAQLDVLRGAERVSVELRPRRSCHARFDIRSGRSNNASSDGTYVQVSSDLVNQAADDGELAAIIAHELAHNILRHPQRLKAKERGLSTRRSEVEADRLSVYLLDAAGFAIDGAVRFWGRWGKANDYGIFADGTHPGWRKRIALIEAEAAAIAATRAAGRVPAPPPDLQAR